MVKFIEMECGYFEHTQKKMMHYKKIVNVDKIVYAMPQGNDEYRLLLEGCDNDFVVYYPPIRVFEKNIKRIVK